MTQSEREVVLISNGPGELLTWLRPVLAALKERDPELSVRAAVVPCQFASGRETEIAGTFDVDAVMSPGQFLGSVSTGRMPEGFGAQRGLVLQLGGAANLAVALAKRLGHPIQRYAFNAVGHRALDRLYVPDERTARRARRLGTPASRVEIVGNLVADALDAADPVADRGAPHVLVLPGSRDPFARALIPLFLAVVERLAPRFPQARFIWPVSRMLSEEAIEAGIAGVEKGLADGVAGRRDGERVVTPAGAVLEMVQEEARSEHVRSADVALTIPGTNTLELGIAGVPALVVLPMNAPERIPLEGIGHWIGLLPIVGTPLKRMVVRAVAQGLRHPVSLPNRLAGEAVFEEVVGIVDADDLAQRLEAMLRDEVRLQHRRERLAATMPKPGAARRIAERVVARLDDAG